MGYQNFHILGEFKEIDFFDKRLNNRFQHIISILDKTPVGRVSRAFSDANDQQATYRFFNNEKITFQQMLEAHCRSTLEQCKHEKTVLAIQDSTSLHLKGAGYATDLDYIGCHTKGSSGLNVHTTLLVNTQGVPLGIGDFQIYERQVVKTAHGIRDKLPAHEKESGRWLNSVANVRAGFASTKFVWIADREGDFWDYFVKMVNEGELFVQRVSRKRKIAGDGEDYFDYVKKAPPMGEDVFEVDSKGGEVQRKKRKIVCEVRMVKVEIMKPRGLPRETEKLEVQLIHVREKGDAKEGLIEWFLVTNIVCVTFEDVLEKIRWYRLRWCIEELHRVVKSGCCAEEMQLGSKGKLTKLLFLLFVVGRRVLWITKASKEDPERPCTEVFSEDEWRMLYIRKHKKSPSERKTPTLQEVVRWVAALGGFNDYNKKRNPGTMTIWIGLKRLAEGFEMHYQLKSYAF